MEQPVILSKLEQEALLHAIEAALPVREARQFFLWTQGQMQALLPHQVMVCLRFGADDELVHSSCLHSGVLDVAVRSRLADPADGLALRLARHCRASLQLPASLAAGDGTAPPSLQAFQAELRACGVDNALLHGTARLPGGASCFVLFGLPHAARARQAYFLALLLPYLHLSWQCVSAGIGAGVARADGALARPVSAREAEILYWVKEGKSNDEIGQLLGISGLTVKNHLQRLYRLLGVSNRAHAIARCGALRVLERPRPALASAA
ncbi:helix-turn-helix transcriptional regulator [Duganella sp. FT3S]|uniref:Helix-turn-helix transcriptional regulator n=1 Tax=Rugamonas fusca TaxID=2758568 RepID=A0A7W2I8H2_9BURK|nr:LuxR C-terminal-related transcriptional regulator [Rugamonas fusca]MBA5607607.1 helix-turn-helix transcriptional regulator [Rugamonas fusca]